MKKMMMLAMLVFAVSANSRPTLTWTPLLQQTSLYFSSDRVTMAGVGAGAGVSFTYKQYFVAQGDVNVLWANGNAIVTRLAFGYKRNGFWAPSFAGTFGILSGHRTEILSRTGKRPAAPFWLVGLRGSLLRFENSQSFVSVLELGCGVGPDNGLNMELTILSAGVRW